jgi:hypothetical protein
MRNWRNLDLSSNVGLTLRCQFSYENSEYAYDASFAKQNF